MGTGSYSKARPHVRRSFSLLRLPLRVSERRLLLTGLDLLAMNVALLLALGLRPRCDLWDWSLFLEHPLWFLLLSGLWLPLAHASDAYDLKVASRFSTTVPAVVRASLLTTLVYLLIPFLTPTLPRSRSMLMALPLLIIVLLLIGRGLYVFGMSQPLFRRRVFIIGAGWAGRTIAQVLAEHSDGTYQVVGFIDDDPDKQGKIVTGRASVSYTHLTLPTKA